MLTLLSNPLEPQEPAEPDRSAGSGATAGNDKKSDPVNSLLGAMLAPRPSPNPFPDLSGPGSIDGSPPLNRPIIADPAPPAVSTPAPQPIVVSLAAEPVPTPAVAPHARLKPPARALAVPVPDARFRAALGAWVGRAGIAFTALALVVSLLMVAVPMVAPIQEFAVLSGSMTPTIPVGALVVDARVPASQLKTGDVITFQPPGRSGVLETHRIYSQTPSPSGSVVLTKGDANPRPDSWRLTLSGQGWRVLFSVPWLGYLMIMAKTTLGRMLLIVIPALILGGLYAAELRPRAARRTQP